MIKSVSNVFTRVCAAGLMLGLVVPSIVGATKVSPARRLPEFTSTLPDEWIQSPPLRVADLRGKVVLIDVWTFECWNCYRSFPWLTDLESRLAKEGLQVIGIHSPEFDRERRIESVRSKAREFGLKHPIMIDNDMRYWQALGNRYWPAYYLVDRKGRIRHSFFGETHQGDAQARTIEAAVKDLLAEPSTGAGDS